MADLTRRRRAGLRSGGWASLAQCPLVALVTTQSQQYGALVHAGSVQAVPVSRKSERVPFGTYLLPELQRVFTARCELLGIEQAIRSWLERNQA
ncbi:hypothetical protein [Streptomyces sp. NPDC002187]|uniref:hypothetical protein n=1 Tax=Streptomyces sp. NPDC002187 TaxID=3364637 RepID=UPI00369DC1C5